jgi:mono/diheme cytochrome c family protein
VQAVQKMRPAGPIDGSVRIRTFSIAEVERPMPRIKTLVATLAIILSLATLYSRGSELLLAQNRPDTAPSTTPKLSEQESRGENFFRQRCSLCHLPRNLKFGSPATIGPNLSGVFKEAGPDQQKLLRGIILKGSPNMPGFQYGLEPREVDDLIAYLKTL